VIVEKLLALPLASLADIQVLLQFMGRECLDLVPCPSNDRQDELTRSFDLLVAAVDRIAGTPGGFAVKARRSRCGEGAASAAFLRGLM
jgi:hypothetical protein